MPPTPDYSHYNLEQLYHALCFIDRQQFPDRLVALKREIKLKGGNPAYYDRYYIPPYLQAVRGIVQLEYATVAFVLIYMFLAALINLEFVLAIEPVAIAVVLSLAGWMGVAAMRRALKWLDEESAVATGCLVAFGLAPFSAFLYFTAVTRLMASLNPKLYDMALFFLVPTGFYMPFVLITCWLKYRYRKDEF